MDERFDRVPESDNTVIIRMEAEMLKNIAWLLLAFTGPVAAFGGDAG